MKSFAAILCGWLLLNFSARAAINEMQLGAHFTGASNVNFRVYSSRATRMEVWIYDTPLGSPEIAHYELTKDATNVWSHEVAVGDLKLTNVTGTICYGYRAWGPNWPFDTAWTNGSAAGFVSDVDAQGNRFNPNKLLLDPYAREVSHDPITPGETDGTVYASGPSYRNLDSGLFAPKGIVLREDGAAKPLAAPRALKDDIIYEVHLRGFTKADTNISEALRGTFKGAALKAPYLAKLGVTAVEFLPVQETQNDMNDADALRGQPDNYWGYSTLDYFAPDRHYASDKSPGGPTREFQDMVTAFHKLNIKVFMDVAYNHTGEGYAWQSGNPAVYNLISWRGLDNPAYYSLTADFLSCWDNTGCGGNYNTFNHAAQNLIVDSLAYWRDTMGVDGFRFDLASLLGNTIEHGGFNYDKVNPSNAINRIARELNPRPYTGGAGVDLIAEPWAASGDGSYEVGGFPWGWSEWNGKYRDAVRRAQNKLGIETEMTGDLATRFAGSSDLYGDGRRPCNSIDFVTCHDGFTLRDLYCYNGKQNQQPWPYGPSDNGSDSNLSWDQNGDAAAERQAARTGMALLLLSAGTPMLDGGDEFLRGLHGNNNPYNLDNAANWLSYAWETNQATFDTFVQRMIAFRKAHPALHPANFYSGADNNGNGMEQIKWFTPAGAVADAGYFNDANNHALAYRIDGTELGDPSGIIYVAYNGWKDDMNFKLPWPGNGRNWYLVMDTSAWKEGPDTVSPPGNETDLGGQDTMYLLHSRAVALMIAK